jgi:HEAT repeat protein
LLGDPDARVRRAACRGAGRRELRDLGVVMNDDPVAEVRREAARTLRMLADPGAAPALIEALSDRDQIVRAGALGALVGVLPRGRLLAALARELDHPARRRRRAAPVRARPPARVGGGRACRASRP